MAAHPLRRWPHTGCIHKLKMSKIHSRRLARKCNDFNKICETTNSSHEIGRMLPAIGTRQTKVSPYLEWPENSHRTISEIHFLSIVDATWDSLPRRAAHGHKTHHKPTSSSSSLISIARCWHQAMNTCFACSIFGDVRSARLLSKVQSCWTHQQEVKNVTNTQRDQKICKFGVSRALS